MALFSLVTLVLVMRYGESVPKSQDNVDPTLTPVSQAKTTMEEAQHLVRTTPLLVFSKTYCPFSKSAKAILASQNLKSPPTIIEVDLRDDAAEVKAALTELSGRSTFPNVFVQGISVGGAAELEEMDSEGTLYDLLERSSLISTVEI